MFGAKKRLYRNEVAKVIVGLALPSDMEEVTNRVYLLLKPSIDTFYSQNMLPIQAAMTITYTFVTNLAEDKDNPEKLAKVNELSEIFVAAASAMVAKGGPADLFTKEIKDEIKTILKALSPYSVGVDDTRTFGDVLSEAKKRQKVSKMLMKKMEEMEKEGKV
jgi:adenylylsulfate kinase-like enzyme